METSDFQDERGWTPVVCAGEAGETEAADETKGVSLSELMHDVSRMELHLMVSDCTMSRSVWMLRRCCPF